ncbi:MAG TPA: ABC transporter ATP-binding protein [Candidatus Paceibacterota bacterium]|nr:ABC transporter ATP-binding protein [Candidatus Paceibacterota bacterium]
MAQEQKFAPLAVLKVYGYSLKKHWVVLAVSLVAMVLATVLGVVVPLFYKNLLDLLSVHSTSDTAPLIGVLLTILGLNFTIWVFHRIAQFSQPFLVSRTMNELSQLAFSNLLTHSYGFFVNNIGGSLVRKVNRLSHSFEDILDRFFFLILPLTVSLGGIIFVLFLRSPWLGGIFLAWAIILIVIQCVLALWKLEYSFRTSEKDSEASGALADALGNEATVKLFTGAEHERTRFGKIADELDRLRLAVWRFDEYVNTVQALFAIAIEFGLLYAGVLLWQKGILTVGDFALIQAYIISAIDQLWNFGHNLRKMYESFVDATEIVEIINTPPEIRDTVDATSLMIATGKIEFRDVDFNFNETRPVLTKFNLKIEGGEKIALIGSSGAGKSTLTKLLLRFYDVTGGTVYLDGQNIAHVTQESLRDAISLVPQDPVLFHRSLIENIRYGRRDASDEEVIDAARKAHCEEFINALPDKYETLVGERGVKLSGGERQRVAIARAILKNAPILILDEATSSLDSESEALIQDALSELMTGKTVIAIAHRLSTIVHMDRIIVMEEGKVVHTGTHHELIAEGNNLYKKLWAIQAGGFIGSDS